MDVEEVAIYFSLGSNLGRRQAHLKFGIDQLGVRFQLVDLSPIYETEAWGYSDQPYLNMVAHYRTAIPPEEIIGEIGKIEKAAGRDIRKQKTQKSYAARTLDIDILFYGNKIFENFALKIPHPRLHLRNFVLWPFSDIAPGLIHPVLGQSIEELKKESTDNSKIERIAERL